MNTYKKFSTYLLTHQPLLWHSMAIQLTLVAVLLNILFYGMGFLRMNLFTLKNSYNIENLFFNETFSLFWIISGIIILIIWGAYFYRNNAAKNFYPISRWYFHKLAVLLFIPALIYFMVPFSFFRGVAHQTQQIISKKTLFDLEYNYVHARPFLICQTADYNCVNRKFPQNYKNIDYWSSNDYYKEYYNQKNQLLNVYDHLENAKAEPINGGLYAYRVESRIETTIKNGDTCYNSRNYFVNALTLDSLTDFHQFHVKNFSNGEFLNNIQYTSTRFFGDYDYEEFYFLKDSILTKIHNLMDNEPSKILETLNDFKNLIDQFEVYNTLQPDKNYEYLRANDFIVHRRVTKQVSNGGSYYLEGDVDDLQTVNEKMRGFSQSVAFDDLQNLIKNANNAYHAPFFYDQFLKYLFRFLALAGVLLLLYFEWGSILAFVISIPVAGAFAILGTLLFALAPRSDSFALLIIVLFGAFFLVMAYLALKGRLKPMVGNIAITLSYFMFPLWVLIILGYIQVAFSYYDYGTCDAYGVTVYPFEFNAEPVSTILLYAPFVLFFISLFAVKKVLAKKE